MRKNGGIAILVASTPRETLAHYRLEDPRAVRQWLDALVAPLEVRAANH